MKRVSELLLGAVRDFRTSPSGADELFPAWCEAMSEDRGKDVTYELVAFPPASEVTGICFPGRDRDLLVVEATAALSHQITIFGHETYHLYCGGCDLLLEDGSGAAGRLTTRDTHGREAHRQALLAAVELVSARLPHCTTIAARSHSTAPVEQRADRFGLQLAARYRRLVAPPGSVPNSPLAHRIKASLGTGAKGRK
ncbi:hypothetical protein [Streptomyces sp. MNP-20]|uniref:hypothetical protein n=1 Tax=Streptomyces sp. MNP-20 TaxID=2721165 RepID=UPI001553E0BD|nr:hypothetical protein [Streptomyces sp. MNP-20]